MASKDNLVILGIFVVIILNVMIINMINANYEMNEHDSITGGAVMIKGELDQNDFLFKCCDLPDEYGCYVVSESGCMACESECS